MGRGAHDRPGATPTCRRSRAELRRTVSASAPTTGTSGDHAWVDVPFKKGARYHVVANQAGTTKVVRAERVLRPVRTAPPTHLSAAPCHGLAAVHMHRSSGSRVRTCDLGINSPALCQLSYPGKDSGQDSRGPNRVVIFGDSPHEPLSGAMPDSSLRRGAVAQRLEHGTHNASVAGSTPARPTLLHLELALAVCSEKQNPGRTLVQRWRLRGIGINLP